MPSSEIAHVGTILVVEDHSGLLEAMTEYLQEVGFVCRKAASLRDAFEEAHRQPLEVVIADHHLPDGEGLALLRSLASEPFGPELILTTGDRDVEPTGFRVLRKPVELPMLVAELRAAVARYRGRAWLRTRGT